MHAMVVPLAAKISSHRGAASHDPDRRAPLASAVTITNLPAAVPATRRSSGGAAIEVHFAVATAPDAAPRRAAASLRWCASIAAWAFSGGSDAAVAGVTATTKGRPPTTSPSPPPAAAAGGSSSTSTSSVPGRGGV